MIWITRFHHLYVLYYLNVFWTIVGTRILKKKVYLLSWQSYIPVLKIVWLIQILFLQGSQSHYGTYTMNLVSFLMTVSIFPFLQKKYLIAGRKNAICKSKQMISSTIFWSVNQIFSAWMEAFHKESRSFATIILMLIKYFAD